MAHADANANANAVCSHDHMENLVATPARSFLDTYPSLLTEVKLHDSCEGFTHTGHYIDGNSNATQRKAKQITKD